MTKYNLIKLVATDLDGTLLSDDKIISYDDLESLRLLGSNKIVRVAATGRSMFKVNEVLPDGVPLDYIVFSSGGGIYDWNKKELLTSEQFETGITNAICKFLLKRKLNFLVYQSIPRNNLFQYHKGEADCDEFDNYLNRHQGDFNLLDETNLPHLAGQFMSIILNDEVLFESIRTELYSECSEIKVIRTTSPIDSRFIWLEIFPATVSKGHGLKWLCDYLSIPYSQTVGIGNDYNDLDMFEFVTIPFLLGNSPASLKMKFPTVSETNNQSGFSKIVKRLKLLV